MRPFTKKIASAAVAAVASLTLIGGGAASAAPQAPAKARHVTKADKAKADKGKNGEAKDGAAHWESGGGDAKHHFKPRR